VLILNADEFEDWAGGVVLSAGTSIYPRRSRRDFTSHFFAEMFDTIEIKHDFLQSSEGGVRKAMDRACGSEQEFYFHGEIVAEVHARDGGDERR